MDNIKDSGMNVMYKNSTLTESVLKVAKEELGESNEVRARCLRLLRNKIEETKKFKPRTDDTFLLKFLRVAKYDVTKAFNKMKFYYRQRIKYPEIFDELLPSTNRELRATYKSHYLLPYRNKDNTAVVIATKRLGLSDPSWVNVRDDIRLDLMFLESVTEDPVTQICGVTAIVDIQSTLLGYLGLITPRTIHTYLNTVAESFPVRYRQVHIVNFPTVCRVAYNIVQPFLSQKIKKRIIIHPNDDNWKSLHAHISPDILPKEYGGNRGSMDYSFLQDLIEEKEEQFKMNLKYGYQKH